MCPDLAAVGPVASMIAVVLGVVEVFAFLALVQKYLCWKRLAAELLQQLNETVCVGHAE